MNRYRKRITKDNDFKWYFDCIKRDNYKCVDCDFDKKEKLIVHHIDESREMEKLNNDLENLVTLCRPCHARRHGQTNNKEDIKEMRESGMTLEKIGKKIGVSRQRIYQIINSSGY